MDLSFPETDAARVVPSAFRKGSRFASPGNVVARARRWSQRVTRESNALDLERGVFSQKDPRKIARSLKRSAERSERRKSAPFRSAMSMLVFYINRAGRTLPAAQRRRLEKAKEELRGLYGREPAGTRRRSRRRARPSAQERRPSHRRDVPGILPRASLF
jgi:hypothetical protein